MRFQKYLLSKGMDIISLDMLHKMCDTLHHKLEEFEQNAENQHLVYIEQKSPKQQSKFKKLRSVLQSYIKKHFGKVENHEVWTLQSLGLPQFLNLPIKEEVISSNNAFKLNFPPSTKYVPSSACMVELMLGCWSCQSFEESMLSFIGQQVNKKLEEKIEPLEKSENESLPEETN